MIEKQITKEIKEQDIEHLKQIIGYDSTNKLEYGYPGEVDEEAANGYILEIVVRRKSVK